MKRFTSFVRRPVKRLGSEQYLLVMLLSFAISVTLTRLFLELTGYPQLGGGRLHIAHVLWGGLLLFVASLLPLMMANRWVYMACAILSGTGVGLFIDEVGKFITAENDYFYPLAAPIIYAFFLLTVLVYQRVSRPATRGPRAEMFRALDAMEEVLEHDLDPRERAELEKRLRIVAEQDSHPALAHLASELLEFLYWEHLELVEPPHTLTGRLQTWWQKFEARWVTRLRLRAVLAGGLLAQGLVALSNMFMALPFGPNPSSLERTIQQLMEAGLIQGPSSFNWFLARIALESTVGLMILVSAGLFIANRDRIAVPFGYWSLLLSLTTVNLLVFYFDQFSTIITASVQFFLLLLVAYYRKKYVEVEKITNRSQVVPERD